MNRVFVYGVALFFAIVGIALLGGEKKAVAGHGCNGSHGVVACDGADVGCAAVASRGRCFGRMRHHAGVRRGRCEGRQRLLGRRRCAGRAMDCCGVQPVDCCGAVVVEGTPTEAVIEPAPVEDAGGEAPAVE